MQAMQAILQNRRIQFRLLSIGALWLIAALIEYAATRQPGNALLLPPEWQQKFAAVPFEQISTEFPIFAQTIAASVLGVLLMRCARFGAFIICATCALGELLYEFGQRSDFSSWLIPIIPRIWPLQSLPEYLGRGTFSANHVMTIVLGSVIAFLVVLNTIPKKK
jgi:hypothetical protein